MVFFSAGKGASDDLGAREKKGNSDMTGSN